MAEQLQTPDPGDDERFALLVRLLKLGSFINGPMKDGVCDPCEVSQIEMKVLMALAGEGNLAGHDLVEIMGLPAMNVSRALAGLRAQGWIEDARDPDNRRRRPVRLSAAGWSKYRETMPALETLAADLLASLSARQLREFSGLADRVISSMADWITSHHAEVKLRS